MSLSNTTPRPASDAGNVLVVDDEPELRAALRRILVPCGHAVVEAASVAQALAALGRSLVDVVVLDLGLPDGSGLEVLRAIKASGARTAVLIFTGSTQSQDLTEALQLGISGYVHKPADALTLGAQVGVALSHARAVRLADARVAVLRPASSAVGGDLAASLEQLPFHLDRRS